MHYTIHQLKIFLKVVETRSITKASKELFMTQPAVSIQLKNFQDQFDVPLTEVVGRQLYVTDFGIEIASFAERVVQEIDNITYKTREYKGVLSGKLSISSASTGKYVFPYFLSGYLEKNNGIDLNLDVTNKQKVIESLKSNLVDFAFVSVVPEGITVNEELILENKLYLVGNVPARDERKPLLYREVGSATRSAMEEFFGTNASRHRKRIELTSNEAVKQAVIAGLGFSVLPLIGMQNELQNKQLYIIPSAGLPIKTEWRLIWLKYKKLSPVAEAFLAYVRENKEDILKKNFGWRAAYVQDHS